MAFSNGMNRKHERKIVGGFMVAGLAWALTAFDLHAFGLKVRPASLRRQSRE
jgi:hypothetical protein